MIIEGSGRQFDELSDTESVDTLTTRNLEVIPRHYLKFIFASLLIALLSFIFTLDEDIYDGPEGSVWAVPTILAFIFLLPHHVASLLLAWLRYHQLQYIFRFSPCLPFALAYATFLALLWVASTATSAVKLRRTLIILRYISRRNWPSVFRYFWRSFASTFASFVELVLVICIVIICAIQRRRQKAPSPTPVNRNPESKPARESA